MQHLELKGQIRQVGNKAVVKAFRKHGVAPEDCFDHLFLSHEMQLAKPDPRIFYEVIETTGIKPEETLFLDDSRSNIETAKNIGFQAQLVPMNKLESITQKIYLQEQDRKNHNLWNSDCQIKIT